MRARIVAIYRDALVSLPVSLTHPGLAPGAAFDAEVARLAGRAGLVAVELLDGRHLVDRVEVQS